MGILKRRLIREKKSPEVPPAEIPAGSANSAQAPNDPGDAPISTSKAAAPPGTQVPKWLRGGRKLSLVQKVFIVGIIFSAAFLTYSLVSSPSIPKTPLQANTAEPATTPPALPASASLDAGLGGMQKQEGWKDAVADKPPPVAEINATLRSAYSAEVSSAAKAGSESSLRSTSQTPNAQKDTSQPVTAWRAGSGQVEAKAQTEPLSLQLAEGYYTAKDYDKAYDAYERLRQSLPDWQAGLAAQSFELVRDFLQLRMAFCLEKKADFDKANQMLKAVSESQSIALRAIANYHSALLEMNAGQYLKARTRAYKTIALTSALVLDAEWALTLERECHFLAAEAVTRQVLSLCDADKELPRQLWSQPTEKDPLAGLNETQLQATLNSGIERLNSGLLAPQIRAVESSHGAPGLNRWSVVCNGPGVEELMTRFAANAKLDVRWVHHADDVVRTEQSAAADWNRSVTLYLPAATTQQVATIAAGAVGLLAQVDDTRLGEGANEAAEATETTSRSRTGTVTITDPTEYSALSEHILMLNEHAIWLWRRLLLMYSGDLRIPNAHFALGVLQRQKDQVAEAIAEYKLVANRYSQTALAPFALLRSSRIKTELRDYAGATSDLKQLIEQYPDNDLIGQAHLDLAETAMKAGLYDEACSLYKKAYNLGFSTESKTVAALGAGKCFYQINDYESTVKWLTRYLEAVMAQQQPTKAAAKPDSKSGDDLYAAYLLLGKANLALGNLEAACEALGYTVRRAADSDEYIEAISALVETQIRQEDFVAALGTIENVRAWPLSQEQVTQLLLLKSSVLRTIGLTDQVITLLADKTQYLTNPRLKANVILELARCHVAAQNLDLARAHFIEALSLAEPGPLAQQVSLELAEVCLKLGEYRQTISICTQLLDSSASEQIKQQCSKILASAYSKQEDYDKAAMSLLTTANRQ